MTLSDAIPVQFWLVDCDTYNEEERYGQNSRCFCAPWQCDDEIKVQLQDDPGKTLALLIVDEEGSIIDSKAMSESPAGIYSVSFIPSENTPEICSRDKIQLKIRAESGFQPVTLPALDLWATDGGAGSPWTTGATPSIDSTIFGTTSEKLYVDYPYIAGQQYRIIVNFTCTNNVIGNLSVYAVDGSNTPFFTQTTTGFNAGANSTTALIFTATTDTTRIAVALTFSGSSSTNTITSVEGSKTVGSSVVLAKSDCLSLLEEQVGTVLLAYSNHRNYAGIRNSNGSPDLTFYLRIPAVFNEERFPETDEPLQLSNNRIISLNSQVKAQKLLETDQLPNYMHLKVKEVLKHQFVTIESKDYVKEEPYEQMENANKKWPFRRYNCWLTEKEYVVRNIL